ncbi:MAG: mechanosensitive ion channel domain-containing protein [Bacteroidota bacterium]
MDIIEILQDLTLQFLQSVPNVLKAILVFVIGWILASVVSKIIRKVLSRIGIDGLAGKLNEIEIVQKANFKIVPSHFFSKLVYYLMLLLFLMASTDVLGMAAVSQLMNDIIGYVPFMISALIVLVIGTLLAEFIKNIVLTACRSLGIPSANLIASFVFWFVFLTALVSALSQAQIDTSFITSNLSTILAGGVAAFALGYGLASRDMMANFLASIYSKDKFKLGDVISVNGVKGKIIAIDKSSLVLGADDRKVIIPLHKLTTESVEVFEA